MVGNRKGRGEHHSQLFTRRGGGTPLPCLPNFLYHTNATCVTVLVCCTVTIGGDGHSFLRNQDIFVQIRQSLDDQQVYTLVVDLLLLQEFLNTELPIRLFVLKSRLLNMFQFLKPVTYPNLAFVGTGFAERSPLMRRQ